jgi:hypothetical protein
MTLFSRNGLEGVVAGCAFAWLGRGVLVGLADEIVFGFCLVSGCGVSAGA